MPEENTLSPEESALNMWRWQWRRRMAVARHEYAPVTVLKGGQILNVFTGELERKDVAIDAGVVAAVGEYSQAREVIDATGLVIAPSFIEPHLHLESTLLWPTELARAVVPRGTGLIITDPHEMANVAGLAGITALRNATKGLPLDVRFTIPSCVPASPLEVPGATIGPDDIAEMLTWEDTVALGEMMNFPGVFASDPAIARQLWQTRHLPHDGHAPGLMGDDLQVYAGAGMSSDHESVTLEEAREKLAAGLFIMLRQGSSEKNLLDLLPLVNDENWHRFAFCSDDRDCHDLLAHGHMDDILRIAIGAGLDPIRAIRMATWNPARHWRLEGYGAVAPGYRANLVTLSSLDHIDVVHTFHQGRLVAEAGKLTAEIPDNPVPESLLHTVNLAPVRMSHLAGNTTSVAMQIVPGQIVTETIQLDTVVEGPIQANVANDLLKIVCVERHNATGAIGVGLVRGFGLTKGAIASTIAHDAHNIVAVGTTDDEILRAIAVVAASQGGLAVVADGDVVEHLPLPIAGLLSDTDLESTADAYARLERAARDLGSPLASPFGQLAFVALSVIPEARITTRGVVDLR